MNTPTQEVVTLKAADSIRAAKTEFAALLRATGTDIERFQNNAIMAVNNNDDIRKGEVTTKSIFNVCSRAANDGVMLDGREAALVLGSKKVNGQWVKEAQYRVMAAGLMKMINRCPDIEYISCQTVHENDICEISFVTDGVPIKHTPDLKKGRGEIIGAYVVAKLKNGEWTSPEYMSIQEILSVRDAYSKKDAEGNFSKMWRDSLGEACKKTVLHRAIKRLPITNDAILPDDDAEIEPIDVTPAPVEKPKRKSAAEKVKEQAIANPSSQDKPVIVDSSVVDTTISSGSDNTEVPVEDNEIPL